MDNQTQSNPENAPRKKRFSRVASLAKKIYPKSFFPKTLILFIVIVMLLLSLAEVYYAIKLKKFPQPLSNIINHSPLLTVNWKTYKNTTLGFEIKYPADYKIEETSKLLNNRSDIPVLSIESSSSKKKWVALGGMLPSSELVNHSIISIYKQSTEFYQAIDENFFLQLVKDGYTREFNRTENSYGEKFIRKNNTASYGAREEVKIYLRPPTLNAYIITIEANTLYNSSAPEIPKTFYQILSTFKFLDNQTSETSPTPTCRPRPACLDATPRCLIPETADMCPKAVTCTQDAKLCPDGKTYVGRQGPNCEFAPCPGQ